MISTGEAIERLRADPEFDDLIRYSYLGDDTDEAARRFERSGEFQLVLGLLGESVPGGQVLDLGAGTGIASCAFARAGASRVFALEPDPSPVVGRGALERVTAGLPVAVLDASAEAIPLPDASVDAAYCRQVLHHIEDLAPAMREVRRVLRPGAPILASREHVVDDEAELAEFLAQHAVHQLAGGEGAHTLKAYRGAIREAGLELVRDWGPYDSLLNAFPVVHSVEELEDFRRGVLGSRLAAVSKSLGWAPGVSALVRRRLAPYTPPGRMHSFLARRAA